MYLETRVLTLLCYAIFLAIMSVKAVT